VSRRIALAAWAVTFAGLARRLAARAIALRLARQG
jgi:hypothetical protein